jgi:hypothetical protein
MDLIETTNGNGLTLEMRQTADPDNHFFTTAMLAKLFSTLLHTLFWAIPAWILHPWAGAAVLALGVAAFYFDTTRFTWLSDRGSIWDRMRQVWRLLGTLFYWTVGTAALSGVAYLLRLGWETWRAASAN